MFVKSCQTIPVDRASSLNTSSRYHPIVAPPRLVNMLGASRHLTTGVNPSFPRRLLASQIPFFNTFLILDLRGPEIKLQVTETLWSTTLLAAQKKGFQVSEEIKRAELHDKQGFVHMNSSIPCKFPSRHEITNQVVFRFYGLSANRRNYHSANQSSPQTRFTLEHFV